MPQQKSVRLVVDTDDVQSKQFTSLSKPKLIKNDVDNASKLFEFLRNNEPDQIGLMSKLYSFSRKQLDTMISDSSRNVFKRMLNTPNVQGGEIIESMNLSDIAFGDGVYEKNKSPDVGFQYSSNIVDATNTLQQC